MCNNNFSSHSSSNYEVGPPSPQKEFISQSTTTQTIPTSLSNSPSTIMPSKELDSGTNDDKIKHWMNYQSSSSPFAPPMTYQPTQNHQHHSNEKHLPDSIINTLSWRVNNKNRINR